MSKDGIEISIEGIEIIEEKFAQMEVHLRKAMPVMTKRALLYVKENVQRNCPVKTGHLRMSFWPKVDQDGFGGKVGSNSPYLPALEFGSGLYGEKKAKYLIAPVKGKAISWIDKSGKRITVKRVMHPGIKPDRKSVV